MDLKLDAKAVEDLIIGGFKADRTFVVVEDLKPGVARVRVPFRNWMVRPGNVVSGPALFTAADLAMYAVVLGHVGPELMSVTSNLNIHFLNRGTPGDITAEARLLKLGRKLAVIEVGLWCAGEPALVAQVTGSYSLPTRSP